MKNNSIFNISLLIVVGKAIFHYIDLVTDILFDLHMFDRSYNE